MNKVREILTKVFTSNTTGTRWLAILRIGAALAFMGKLISEFRCRYELYTSHALVPPDVAVFSQNRYIPTILGIYHQCVQPYFPCSEHAYVRAFFIVGLLLAISLLAGSLTRLSAFFCWAMMAIIFNSSHLTSYGFDALLLTLLFYCMIFPVGKVSSLDNKIRAKVLLPDDSTMDIFHKTLQLHVCLIYFVNGINKIHGHSWQDGSGMWDAINQPQFHSLLTPLLQRLLMISYIPMILSISTILIEITYPFLIWVRKVNAISFLLIILLHIFIAVIMGLWLFAFVMIVLNLAAFGHVLRKERASV